MNKIIISDLDRKIIERVYLDADATVPEIARDVGAKPHVVNYAMKRLLEEKVLRRAAMIDVYPLGYAHYGIFLSLVTASSKRYQELLRYLMQSDRVSFVVELGGDFHLGATVCVRSLKDLSDFLNLLSSKFGSMFSEKVVTARLKLIDYPPALFGRKSRRTQSLSWGISDKRVEIDDVDHTILESLSGVCPDSIKELARQLKMSPTTIDYRVAKLKKSGILTGFRYFIDIYSLGYLNFTALLYVRNLDQKTRNLVLQFTAGHPSVIYAVETLGGWDFELGIFTENARDIVQLSQEISELLGPDLSAIKTLPVFGYPKIRNYPFLKMPAQS